MCPGPPAGSPAAVGADSEPRLTDGAAAWQQELKAWADDSPARVQGALDSKPVQKGQCLPQHMATTTAIPVTGEKCTDLEFQEAIEMFAVLFSFTKIILSWSLTHSKINIMLDSCFVLLGICKFGRLKKVIMGNNRTLCNNDVIIHNNDVIMGPNLCVTRNNGIIIT